MFYCIDPVGEGAGNCTTEENVKNMLRLWQEYCKTQPILSGKDWSYDL